MMETLLETLEVQLLHNIHVHTLKECAHVYVIIIVQCTHDLHMCLHVIIYSVVQHCRYYITLKIHVTRHYRQLGWQSSW